MTEVSDEELAALVEGVSFVTAPGGAWAKLQLCLRELQSLRRSPSRESVLEWKPIESAPKTATRETGYGEGMRVLVYGAQIGVCAGTLHRFEGSAPTASVSHLGGDAISQWGVTHWMPLPSPPLSSPNPQRKDNELAHFVLPAGAVNTGRQR